MDLFIIACRTCSTIIFPHSINQIVNLWHCPCRSCHWCYNSLRRGRNCLVKALNSHFLTLGCRLGSEFPIVWMLEVLGTSNKDLQPQQTESPLCFLSDPDYFVGLSIWGWRRTFLLRKSPGDFLFCSVEEVCFGFVVESWKMSSTVFCVNINKQSWINKREGWLLRSFKRSVGSYQSLWCLGSKNRMIFARKIRTRVRQ